MEQYAQMKSSGVSWIQDIPSTWGIRALFQLAEQVKNKNKDLSEQNLLSLSYGRIKRKDINSPDGLLPASFDGYNIIEANDIVLRLTDLQNDHTSLRVGQAKERGIITSAYTTLRPSPLVNPQYLYYVIHAYDLIKGFYGMGAGVRQGLNYDEVKTIKVPFPSVNEQKRIVSFLDQKVFSIEAAIEEAKSSIEDYKNWKLSIICEAVSKGINSNNQMRICNVANLEECPSSWQTLRIKNVSTVLRGGSPRPIELYLTDDPDGLNWIKIGDTEKGQKLITKTHQKIKKSGLSKTRMVHAGDLLLTNSMSFGEPYILAVDGCIHDGWVCLTDIRGVTKEFLYYFLSSDLCKIQFKFQVAGGVVQNLNVDKIGTTKILVPPIEEQNQIVQYLNNICKEIEQVIAEKQLLIDDLEAYKRSLIYESVTGKIKVM